MYNLRSLFTQALDRDDEMGEPGDDGMEGIPGHFQPTVHGMHVDQPSSSTVLPQATVNPPPMAPSAGGCYTTAIASTSTPTLLRHNTHVISPVAPVSVTSQPLMSSFPSQPHFAPRLNDTADSASSPLSRPTTTTPFPPLKTRPNPPTQSGTANLGLTAPSCQPAGGKVSVSNKCPPGPSHRNANDATGLPTLRQHVATEVPTHLTPSNGQRADVQPSKQVGSANIAPGTESTSTQPSTALTKRGIEVIDGIRSVKKGVKKASSGINKVRIVDAPDRQCIIDDLQNRLKEREAAEILIRQQCKNEQEALRVSVQQQTELTLRLEAMGETLKKVDHTRQVEQRAVVEQILAEQQERMMAQYKQELDEKVAQARDEGMRQAQEKHAERRRNEIQALEHELTTPRQEHNQVLNRDMELADIAMECTNDTTTPRPAPAGACATINSASANTTSTTNTSVLIETMQEAKNRRKAEYYFSKQKGKLHLGKVTTLGKMKATEQLNVHGYEEESIDPPLRFPKPIAGGLPLKERAVFVTAPTLPSVPCMPPATPTAEASNFALRPFGTAPTPFQSSSAPAPHSPRTPPDTLTSHSPGVPVSHSSGAPIFFSSGTPTAHPSAPPVSNSSSAPTSNSSGTPAPHSSGDSSSDPPSPWHKMMELMTSLHGHVEQQGAMLKEQSDLFQQHTQSCALQTSQPKNKYKATGPFGVKRESQARTVEHNEMMKAVRKAMQTLFGIQADQDIGSVALAGGFFASIDDICSWLENGAPLPSLQPMRPHWETLNSPWNDTLADLFVEEFAKAHPHYDKDAVKDHFLDRLKTLRKYIVRSIPEHHGGKSPLAEQQQLSRMQSRRRSRRKTLFDARLKVALENSGQNGEDSAWHAIWYMVNSLGRDGMSTDDSGDEKKFPTTVVLKEWRSKEVVAILQYVDRNRNFFNCYGNQRPGGHPHGRERNQYAPTSTRMPLACLPINFYNSTWYESLTSTEKRQLAARPAFSLPAIIREAVGVAL